MLTRQVCIIAFFSITTAGCDKIDEKIEELVAAKIQSIEEKIIALEGEKAGNDILYKFTQERIDGIFNEPANVSSDDKGYGIARTKFGKFIVSVEDISPHLDGYKIKLSIGNLTSATFNGASVNLKWGLPFDPKNFDAYQKSQKEKKFTVTNSFRPGAYTEIEAALTPAKPEEVKEFSVGLEFNQLSLVAPLKK